MTDVQDKHSKAAPPLSFLIQTLECHQTSLRGDRRECGGEGSTNMYQTQGYAWDRAGTGMPEHHS